jgi:ABC-type lipoprotein export system ATPase subunit
MGSFIELIDVTKIYGEGASAVRAVDGLSLTADSGEWIAIMGPSGSGKTTLLNLLGCLDQATSGVVRHRRHRHLEAAPQRTGALSQRDRRLHLSAVPSGASPHALENVMLAQFFHSMTDENEAMQALRRWHGRARDASALAAFRRRAAARCHRPRAGERSENHPRRRAHRQPRRRKPAHRLPHC